MEIHEIFTEFIHVVNINSNYIIGLINRDSIVTLCSDQRFVGRKIDPTDQKEQELIFELEVSGEAFGYLWVRGEDSNLPIVGHLLYESLYVRLLYEKSQKRISRRISNDEKLVKMILHMTDFDFNQIIELAKEMNINLKLPRAAILVDSDSDLSPHNVIKLKMYPECEQSIIAVLDKKHMIIFKDLAGMEEMQDMIPYLFHFVKRLPDYGFRPCRFYIGAIQDKIVHYYRSYENCKWLSRFKVGQKIGVRSIYDHITDYLTDQVGSSFYESLFNFPLTLLQEKDQEDFYEIAEALLNNDFNLSKTAKAIFTHRNTLIYKIKKYEQIFNIDIRNTFEGKVILMFLYFALKERFNKIKVGGFNG